METKLSPLLLPDHFLQHVLSCIKNSSKALAIALQDRPQNMAQGLSFLSQSSNWKARGQAARSYNKSRDMCYDHQDVAKGKMDAGYQNFRSV